MSTGGGPSPGGNVIYKPPPGASPDYGGAPTGDTGNNPPPPGPAEDTQTGGLSLGAALLNLSIEESKPQLGGGLSLYARQQRDIDRLKARVSNLEQQ